MWGPPKTIDDDDDRDDDEAGDDDAEPTTVMHQISFLSLPPEPSTHRRPPIGRGMQGQVHGDLSLTQSHGHRAVRATGDAPAGERPATGQSTPNQDAREPRAQQHWREQVQRGRQPRQLQPG